MRSTIMILGIAAMTMTACDDTQKTFDEDTTTTPDVVDVSWDVEPPAGNCPAGWTCRSMDLPTFNGVDILVVVDNSRSMEEEQETMVAQFPDLIENLIWPVLSPYTGKPVSVPVNDVHIGVVSTDMGVGDHLVSTCTAEGDGAVLQNEPYGLGATCEESYPSYLAYDEDAPIPDEVSAMGSGFGCIARLGTGGCGMEQPMESALEALTTRSATGEPNEGFLRDDTILVVIWLTDEGDCSATDESFFDPGDTELSHLNLRCYEHAFLGTDRLHEIQRYVDGFRGLREGTPWPVLLTMIVGVPPDEPLCNGTGDGLEWCSGTTAMLYEESSMHVGGEEIPVPAPSCDTDSGKAYAPRRFVDLAMQFGTDAYVHSICQEDYTPALEFVGNRISDIAGMTCEGSFLQMDKDPDDECGCLTDCDVVHVIDEGGSCPAGTIEWDSDGDTTPDIVRNEIGNIAIACEVPYAGTTVDSCERLCHDPLQHYSTIGEGWTYTLTAEGVACPSITFTEGYDTPSGAYTFVACPAR